MRKSYFYFIYVKKHSYKGFSIKIILRMRRIEIEIRKKKGLFNLCNYQLRNQVNVHIVVFLNKLSKLKVFKFVFLLF